MSGRVCNSEDVDMMSENFEESFHDQEDVYEVEEIIAKKKFGGQWKYKVKWVGYPEEQSTWEPVENLGNIKEMVEEFEKEWKRKSLQENKSKEIPKRANGPGSLKNKSVNTLKESSLNKKTQKDHVVELGDPLTEKKRKITEEERQEINDDKFSSVKSPISQFSMGNDNHILTGPTSAAVQNSKPKQTSAHDPIVIGEDNDSPSVYGSFDAKDTPKRLITARILGSNNEVSCLVEWENRKTGIKPNDSFICNKVLREKCPHLLLDFYESRLRFPNQNK